MSKTVTKAGEHQLSCTLSEREKGLLAGQFKSAAFLPVGKRFRAFFTTESELGEANRFIRILRESS